MDSEQQIAQFEEELESLIARHRLEYSLSYAAMIGALFIQVHILTDEAASPEDKNPLY